MLYFTYYYVVLTLDQSNLHHLCLRIHSFNLIFYWGSKRYLWHKLVVLNLAFHHVAAAEASKEAIWLSGLINDLGLHQDCVNLHCDSQSALHLAMNQVMDGRTKHIDVRYHFIREAIADGKIELVKIDGKLNPADSLTKVIPTKSFTRHHVKFQILHKE